MNLKKEYVGTFEVHDGIIKDTLEASHRPPRQLNRWKPKPLLSNAGPELYEGYLIYGSPATPEHGLALVDENEFPSTVEHLTCFFPQFPHLCEDKMVIALGNPRMEIDPWGHECYAYTALDCRDGKIEWVETRPAIGIAWTGRICFLVIRPIRTFTL